MLLLSLHVMQKVSNGKKEGGYSWILFNMIDNSAEISSFDPLCIYLSMYGNKMIINSKLRVRRTQNQQINRWNRVRLTCFKRQIHLALFFFFCLFSFTHFLTIGSPQSCRFPLILSSFFLYFISLSDPIDYFM